MSKSLGNFFTVRDVLKKYDPEVVRFFILRAHYRSPLNYSDAHLDDAKAALTRLYTALKDSNQRNSARLERAARQTLQGGDGRRLRHARSRGGAVRAGEPGEQRRKTARAAAQGRSAACSACCSATPNEFLRAGKAEDWILQGIADREAARKRKDYAAADRIRKELADKGIVLEDKGGKTTWRRQ